MPRESSLKKTRSNASARAQQLVASEAVPPEVRESGFTIGQTAALCVIVDEIHQRGLCDLTRSSIARLAGVSDQVVKTAISLAIIDGWLACRLGKGRVDNRLVNLLTIRESSHFGYLLASWVKGSDPRSPKSWERRAERRAPGWKRISP